MASVFGGFKALSTSAQDSTTLMSDQLTIGGVSEVGEELKGSGARGGTLKLFSRQLSVTSVCGGDVMSVLMRIRATLIGYENDTPEKEICGGGRRGNTFCAPNAQLACTSTSLAATEWPCHFMR